MPERRQAPRLGAAPEDRSATRRSRHRNAERWVARPPVGADREQRYGQQMATIYTCAAICKPGHVLTRDVSEVSPSKRCTSCGAAVLTPCTSCGSPIQGDLVVPGVVAIGFAYDPPDFCHECGCGPAGWARAVSRDRRRCLRAGQRPIHPSRRRRTAEPLPGAPRAGRGTSIPAFGDQLRAIDRLAVKVAPPRRVGEGCDARSAFSGRL